MDDLKERIAAELIAARDRSLTYTDAEDDLLTRQHSPLMSPLVWDLAHIGNYEELWVLREAGGVTPLRPEIDDLYDAFKHPRRDRPSLPILGPALTPDGAAIEGVTIASAGGHGMMWGPGVARVAADLALTGESSIIDVTDLGLDRFDADGRSRLATDPIALPFPVDAEDAALAR